MMALDRNIWRSRISVGTKLRLYITPAFCQSFCMVRRLGPWQQRVQRHSMLSINGVYAASWIYTGQSASPTTRSDQEPNNHYCLTVRSRRLRFFGHICRADPDQDHSRALYVSTTGLPKHRRRRPGRPRQTWLRTIENDLRPLNLGLATAQRRADTRGNGYVADKLRVMVVMMMMMMTVCARVCDCVCVLTGDWRDKYVSAAWLVDGCHVQVRDVTNRHCGSLQEWPIQWTVYIIYCHVPQRDTFILDKLRDHKQYPAPYARTARFQSSFLLYALKTYQWHFYWCCLQTSSHLHFVLLCMLLHRPIACFFIQPLTAILIKPARIKSGWWW